MKENEIYKRLYEKEVFINWFQRVDKTRLISHQIRDIKYFWAKIIN